MTITTLRTLGFALPVLALATGIHVEKDPSWGSWLDGLLSGAWFAAMAAIGARGAAWLSRKEGPADGRVLEVARGALFGGMTWMLLWAVWKVPGAAALTSQAFGLNCVAFMLAGGFLAPLHGRRPVVAERG